MVVLDKLPGLEVNVQVNGANLQEYNDDEEVEVKPGPVGEHQASRTVSKYIEAVDGAEFSIKCSLSSQFKMDAPNIELILFVDGNHVAGRILGRSNDEARLSNLSKDKAEAEAKKVGTIEVRVWRASEGTPAAPRPCQQKSSSNKFHEKALKGQAKSHNVSYSAETPITARHYANVTKLDGADYPIAIYKLKYRSKEALKQLLIIERTPEPEDSPTPSPAPDVDLDNLTPAQRERLKVFLRNEEIAADRASNTPDRKIKREIDHEGGDSNLARRKRSKTTRVIDLTADSGEDE
ncbi:hypothetical protein NHQ30_002717 [Ciborinia camelliae]|nr:hypothetical protein NHQ30_002717 [Ciborinia camelliae]